MRDLRVAAAGERARLFVERAAGGQRIARDPAHQFVRVGAGDPHHPRSVDFLRELQVHGSWSGEGSMKLAEALPAGKGDCLTTPAVGADQLVHPEPDFYVLGHKSYGRRSDFLLETGYRQAADVIERLAGGRVGVS